MGALRDHGAGDSEALAWDLYVIQMSEQEGFSGIVDLTLVCCADSYPNRDLEGL